MQEAVNLKNLPYKWTVMTVVMIGTLMGALDNSIVNVSIPAIMADFGSGVTDIEWVVTGYMIAFSTLMPLTIWFRDRIGYKLLFVFSLIVFTGGSFLCGMAWDLPSLIAARVIQAFGGGAVLPTGMSMISEVFPHEERGRAMGIWGVGVTIGPTIGPTLGGYLTKEFGWRSIFMINIPIGILSIIMAWYLLIKDIPGRRDQKPFDFWGFIFLSSFLVTLLLSLSKGESKGWTSPFILTCITTSLLSFILFILAEINTSNGIIDLRLFKTRVFSACSGISIIRAAALFGGIFMLPLFLQQQMGYDEMQSGLILMPGALAVALFMPVGGRMSDSLGARIPTITGIIIIASYMFMYRYISVKWTAMDIIIPTLVNGLGMGFMMAPVMAAALNAAPPDKSGMVSTILSISMQVGGAIGIALLTTVLSNRANFHLSVLGTAVDPTGYEFTESFRQLAQHIHSIGYTYASSAELARSTLFQHISQRAVEMSFQDAFIIAGFIILLSLIPALLLPGRKDISTNKMKEKAAGKDFSSGDIL